jgi:hypothetical protein
LGVAHQSLGHQRWQGPLAEHGLAPGMGEYTTKPSNGDKEKKADARYFHEIYYLVPNYTKI